MHTFLLRSALLGILFALVTSGEVVAQSPRDIIDQLAPQLSPAQGTAGEEFGSIAAYVASRFMPLVNVIAILAVVVSGLMMTFSQDDSHVARSRRVFLSSLAGIALVYTAAALRNAVITPGGTGIVQSPDFAAGGIGAEIEGIVNWIQVPLATIAMLMIIISGVRAVVNYGSDEGLVQLRRTVYAVLAGIIIISIRFAIVDSFAISGTPGSLMAEIIRVMQIILSFLALAAVLMIVLAGLYMIVNVGNDEQYTKAKGIIVRVAIGLLVVIASLAIVTFVFQAASA